MAHPYKMQGMMTAFGSKQGITVVARDGDVLLALKETTIRVSSVHLTGLSPFFKVMLGPNFSEGQAARSALVPKRIEMPDDDSVGMVLLCYYVHSGLERVQPLITGFKYYQDIMPTTERIAQLAVAADKYFLLDYLKERDVSRLFHPFRKAGIRYGLTLEQMADLAVAAYLFGQDDLFSLFTRCLILDFSDLSGLATTRFATHIGSQSMVFLDGQQSMLRQHINEAITHECARITCSFCGYTRLDPGFATAVATKLPKLQNTQRYSLREILRALYSVGPYAAFDGERDVLCPDHTYKAVYGKKYYEQAADLLNKNVPGLCYFCMAEGRNEADCEHEMELKQRISRLDTIASQFNANRK